jgi:hypothetical protein
VLQSVQLVENTTTQHELPTQQAQQDQMLKKMVLEATQNST